MIRRALLLIDGPSDAPLGEHLEALCAERGVEVRVTTPDLRRLPIAPGLRVSDRLQAVLDLGGADYEMIFVHRDAEKRSPEDRYREIFTGVEGVRPGLVTVPVVPIRMTEAWLLLDELLIREVAGRPAGTEPLGLPKPSRAESIADPKEALRSALQLASGLSGRRMKQFQNRFGENRRLIFERLDIGGPVRQLTAWQALESSLDQALGEI